MSKPLFPAAKQDNIPAHAKARPLARNGKQRSRICRDDTYTNNDDEMDPASFCILEGRMTFHEFANN